MANRGPVEIAASAEHRAVVAWRTVKSASALPKTILQLKDGKSAVYRLVGVGQAHSDVIAKRCEASTGVVERTVYEDILPRLPVSGVRYFGAAEEDGGEFIWLFLEDAGDEGYSPAADEHRSLIGRWLAFAHTAATALQPAVQLPERGLEYQKEVLRRAREIVSESRGNPVLAADDARLLEKVLCHSAAMESHWEEIETICDAMPRTLVHGGFDPKNVRVRRSTSGPELLPFDWEAAGWGVPAADLSRADIVAYLSTIDGRWPRLDRRAVERLANVGKMFRCFAAIPGEESNLIGPWQRRALEKLRFYDSLLSEATRDAGWGHGMRERILTRPHAGGGSAGTPGTDQAVLVNGAIRAWRTLAPESAAPRRVEIVETSDKSAVLRLRGTGPGNAAVIAKRCRHADATTERMIYEEILPELPVPSAGYYGAVPAEEAAFAWLFLEDLGDLDLPVAGQAALAARWLGQMHTAAATLAAKASRLPDRGSAYFLARLRSARRAVLAKAGSPCLSLKERRMLETSLAQWDTVEAHWKEIEAVCALTPQTLVHGDFVALNLRLRPERGGMSTVPFDWERAGWGAPVVDLVDVDVSAYWAAVKECWPRLSLRDVEEMARYAKLLMPLGQEWEGRPMRKISKRRKRIARALAKLGWSGTHSGYASQETSDA